MASKFSFSFVLLFVFHSFSFSQNLYHYKIDLTKVEDDKIKVILECPKINESSIEFIMPKVIPGTYSFKEYGRYITSVKAYDSLGKSIKIKNKNNIFYIADKANHLKRLEYWVNDTWDDSKTKNFIFQPGGSNIEEGKNFTLNHPAFEGYFEGYKNLPYELEIIKPEFMYGSTYLKKAIINSTTDKLYASNYDELADNPVMYCKPDTSSFLIDQSRIHISSYSPNNLIPSDSIKEWLKPLAIALKNFMGELPVKEYYFIYYFPSKDSKVNLGNGKGLGGFGALEHHHCSFYYLPEDKEGAKEMIQDVGAHEFLHTITPLNLHSKEIADFDFKTPKMSQHLWLYEGVTEYLSWLVRIQNGLVTEEEFLKEMKLKLKRAEEYGNFSFTDMSKNVLQGDNQEKYKDVYLKGAIMAMMLDQLLLKKSEGKYGLKHLIKELMNKYGSNRPFNDDQLFSDIASLTNPDVENFIKRFIQGSELLPLGEFLRWFGYNYTPTKMEEVYYIGSFSISMNEQQKMKVSHVTHSVLNLQDGDVIEEVNGEKLQRSNFSDMIDKYFQYNTSPDIITMKVIRNGSLVTLSGRPSPGTAIRKYIITKRDNLNDNEERLRNAWLKGDYVIH